MRHINLGVIAFQNLCKLNPRLDIIRKLLRYFLQMLLQFDTTRLTMHAFQDGGHNITILLPVSGLVMSPICKVKLYMQTKF